MRAYKEPARKSKRPAAATENIQSLSHTVQSSPSSQQESKFTDNRLSTLSQTQLTAIQFEKKTPSDYLNEYHDNTSNDSHIADDLRGGKTQSVGGNILQSIGDGTSMDKASVRLRDSAAPAPIAQLNGDEVHNWDEVLNKYSTAGKEIDDAFTKAGYHNPQGRRKAILRAMRETGWGKRKIAHSLGKQGSGMRDGTIKSINRCQADLKKWVGLNPPTQKDVNPTNRSKKKKGEHRDEHQESLLRFRIAQFASWARKGDKESLDILRNLAADHEFAQEKLMEIEGVAPSSSGSEQIAIDTPEEDDSFVELSPEEQEAAERRYQAFAEELGEHRS